VRASGVLGGLARLAVRVDAGFHFGRLAIVFPLIAVSQSGVPAEEYATFAAHYHEALIVSLIVLFGANEAFLVRPEPARREGFWQVLALGLAAAAVLFGLNAQEITDYGGGLLLFLLAYRTLFFYFITVSRDRPWLYCAVAAGLAATAGLVLLIGAPALWCLAPLVSVYAVAAVRQDVGRHLPAAMAGFPHFLKENAPYSLNQLAGAAYVQGSLVVFAFLAGGAVYLQATQYIYLMSFAVILTQILYRLFLIKVASESGGRLWGPQSLLQVATGLGLGLMLALFAGAIETAVFGRAVIPAEIVWYFVPTLIAVALQNIFAAYLVGSGHVRLQFKVALATGAALVALIVALDAAGAGAHTVPAAVLLAMGGGVVARYALTLRVRRAADTG